MFEYVLSQFFPIVDLFLDIICYILYTVYARYKYFYFLQINTIGKKMFW